MRMLINEIKKILHWKMIVALLVVNVTLYFFLIDFDIKHFPNGRPALDSYRIGIEMIHDYGTDMDESEIADFKKKYEEEVRKADRFLQSREDFRGIGIQSYEEFQHMDRENEQEASVREKLMFEEKVDLFWELQERERLIEFHELQETIFNNDIANASPSQKERLLVMKEAEQYQVYTETIMNNYQSIIRNIAIVIFISVVLAISPIFLRDRSLQVLALQYTAKKGRSIYKTKTLAGLISTVFVITALLPVYLSLYSQNETSMFFDVPIHTFIGGHYWYDFTFFQYIVITIISIYLLGIAISLLSMAISNIVANFVALIGIQVPILFILLAFGIKYLIDRSISLYLPQWVIPSAYSITLVVGTLLIVLLWRREKKLDIIE